MRKRCWNCSSAAARLCVKTLNRSKKTRGASVQRHPKNSYLLLFAELLLGDFFAALFLAPPLRLEPRREPLDDDLAEDDLPDEDLEALLADFFGADFLVAALLFGADFLVAALFFAVAFF